MEKPTPALTLAERVWFVQVAGRVWGPYPHGRIEAFVAEGRVTPSTRVAPRPEGPFAPAGEQGELDALFAPTPIATADEPKPSGAARPLMVWTDLSSVSPERFETVLAAYGPYVPIRRGLWLVQARLEPAALRNALSRRLRGDDALLVIEAALARTAWFNLGGTAERNLRHLWAGGGDG